MPQLDARERIAALAPLRQHLSEAAVCKICGATAPAFDVVDFNKCCSPDLYPFGLAGIPVMYYRCEGCQFTFTTFFDRWTTEDFSKFIYNDDYICVDGDYYSGVRAAAMAEVTAERLRGCEGARILDYGGGNGLFAKEMQARGFALIESYDLFAAPTAVEGQFDLITCFEVIEHTVSPLAAFDQMCNLLTAGGAIMIGTSIPPENIGEIRANWWYIAPRNGHISIFSLAAMQRVAAARDLKLQITNTFNFLRQPLTEPLRDFAARLA